MCIIERDGMVKSVKGVFFQEEDGIRDGVASRGLGDVYKEQNSYSSVFHCLVIAKSMTASSVGISVAH